MSYVLKRFAQKSSLLLLFALAQIQSPWGFSKALIMMMLFTGLTDIALALFWHERPNNHELTYWDEAAAFLAIAGLIRWLT